MTIKVAITRFIQTNGFAPKVGQVARLIDRPRNRTEEMVIRMVKADELAKFRGRVWVTK